MGIFENCYEELKKKVGKLEITPQTIIKVLKYAMEIVELSEAKGDEQKKLVETQIEDIEKDLKSHHHKD